jgi:hypothetical protein
LSHCQQILINRDSVMTAPAPWSLAWREDGELAPQDRFDLLQSLVTSESLDVQTALIAAACGRRDQHLGLRCCPAGRF